MTALSLLRSYLFTLEPLYTSQIIDSVIIEGKHNLLLSLVLNIVLSAIAFGIANSLYYILTDMQHS